MEKYGMKNWIFGDGDLPPVGEGKDGFTGHESLAITNVTKQDAHILIDILFTDKEPVRSIAIEVPAERVLCIRLDKPFGTPEYKLDFGQYALVMRSDTPVVAVFGRLDIRQPNMAYYIVQGYSYN